MRRETLGVVSVLALAVLGGCRREAPGGQPESTVAVQPTATAVDPWLEQKRVRQQGFWRDEQSGLTWTARDTDFTMDWPGAREYCAGLDLDDSREWRLPTRAEVERLDAAAARRPEGLPIERRTVWTLTPASQADLPELSLDEQYVWIMEGDGKALVVPLIDSARALCVLGAPPREGVLSLTEAEVAAERARRQVGSFTGDERVRDEREYRKIEEAAREAGYVTDPTTGMSWTPWASRQAMTWDAAKGYCRSLSLGGLAHWRLPDLDDLSSIYAPPAHRRYLATGGRRLPVALSPPEGENVVEVWSAETDGDGTAKSYTHDGCEADTAPPDCGQRSRPVGERLHTLCVS